MRIVDLKRCNQELQSKLTLNLVENDQLHKMNENFKLSNKLLLNENEKTKISLKTCKHQLEASEASNMKLKNQIYDFENILKELNEQQVTVCEQVEVLYQCFMEDDLFFFDDLKTELN